MGLSLLLAAALAGAPVPLHHGVVFFCPDDTAEAIRQLEAIQADGFDLIKFCSWVWTIPQAGSPLEARAEAVLDWCDQHQMAFFLLHNIQYGSPGDGGGLDRQVLDPSQTLPLVRDWARVLKGHPSVKGVILGNEVEPLIGSPDKTPRWWAGFLDQLRAGWLDIGRLNRAWGTAYPGFEAIADPARVARQSPDLRHYAIQRFAAFYGTLFDQGFRPELGDKLYGAKTTLDPFLHRACPALSMACWDDLVSEFPLWRIRVAADTVDKPLFNAELHLYNDTYSYRPSIARSRYRYFTSALLGEYLSASFAWGQWKRPPMAAIHAATPGVLADLRKLEADLRPFHQADLASRLRVLVTEGNYYGPWRRPARDAPLARLNAVMGTLGRPWRFLLEDDLATVRDGTLVVCADGLAERIAKAVVALPREVRVLAVDGPPSLDERGLPLATALATAVRARCRVVPFDGLAGELGAAKGLPAQYRRTGDLTYFRWTEQRGHFEEQEVSCLLEARRMGSRVAVVNHTIEPQTAPLAWGGGPAPVTFAPLEVRVYEVR